MGGITDVCGAFHITAGVGFGFRLKGKAQIGGIPFELSVGDKVDPVSIDWGDGRFDVGGAISKGGDFTVAGTKRMTSLSKLAPYLPIAVGESVYHSYIHDDGCTCTNLTLNDMKDCPSANYSSGISGQIGVGTEAYFGIGFSVGAYVDVAQLDRGLKKIINSIADWFGN